MATIKTLLGNVKGQTGDSGKDGSENQIYSTTEQAIGTWIDGRTIYRKVVACGTAPDKTDKTVAHGISNFDHVIHVSGFCKDISNSYPMPFPYDNVNGIGCIGVWIDKINITISCLSTYYPNITETYIILEYVKTT